MQLYAIMNNVILNLIRLCHILVIMFIVLVPFFNNNYFLLLHSICVPFIMLHWLVNDNTCALTLAEQHIREQMSGKPCDKNECFTAHLIEPIYDFKANNEDLSIIIYVITIGLWLLSAGKLYSKYKSGEIQTFMDLVKY